MRACIRPLLWFSGLFLTCVSAHGQGLVRNPSFERGTSGWRLSGGTGGVERFGHHGKTCISVTGTGQDENAWQCTSVSPQPGRRYLVRFNMLRARDSSGGTPVTGFGNASCILPADNAWRAYSFVARIPSGRSDSTLRFGQRDVEGKVCYDDISVYPVTPAYKRIGDVELGADESIFSETYRFAPQPRSWMVNDSRPLVDCTAASYNTNRWIMRGSPAEHWTKDGNWILYRHAVGFPFVSASLTLQIGRYQNGALMVEVSRDRSNWQGIANLSSAGEHEVALPADFFPAKTLWVRLWSTGAFQLDRYVAAGKLSGTPPDCQGETWYFAPEHAQGPAARGLTMEPISFTHSAVRLRLGNDSKAVSDLTLQASLAQNGRKVAGKPVEVKLRPTERRVVEVALPSLAPGEQTLALVLKVRGKTVGQAVATIRPNWAELGGFGQFIADTPDLAIWSAEATRKVFRATAPPPKQPQAPLRLEAAGNEYEATQLVLTPRRATGRIHLRFTPFQPHSPKSPIWDEVALVDYVPVSIPTDWLGSVGHYPDPLISLWRRDRQKQRSASDQVVVELPGLSLKQGNQPLWLTAYVPPGTPAGHYRSTVTVEYASASRRAVTRSVPVKLRVFGFDLPDDMHLRTAYGVGINNKWHRLTRPEDLRQTWDLYMQTCRRYHISPYTPHQYAPIRWELKKQDGQVSFSYDFSGFDAAMERYLDEFHFSSFNLLELPQELDGHQRFTPEYVALYRQLMAPIIGHLREKGWLRKAYCYWIDEPSPDRYPEVKQGMDLLREACPGLKRLLTVSHEKCPAPSLFGSVDLWVAVLDRFDRDRARPRQALGEEVWWYVCTVPKAPYPGNFIDHPALTHRIRYWMAAELRVQGDLYWSTSYFKPNPWEDGQSMKPGGGYWGNGDGRLFYPPTKTQPSEDNPLVAAPIPSIRLALISEGIEDAEYIHILRELMVGKRRNSTLARRAMLGLDRLIRSQTDYVTDPQALHLQRQRIAEAIESLGR